jgi:hypothetical protein
VCPSRVDSSSLVFSLSSDRHSEIGLSLDLVISIHNKQQLIINDKVTHDVSHPCLSVSNLVSRPHAFTPKTDTVNTLSGNLVVRGSCSTSTDSICQTGFGL